MQRVTSYYRICKMFTALIFTFFHFDFHCTDFLFIHQETNFTQDMGAKCAALAQLQGEAAEGVNSKHPHHSAWETSKG